MSHSIASVTEPLAASAASDDYLTLLDQLMVGLARSKWDEHRNFEKALGADLAALQEAARKLALHDPTSEDQFVTQTGELRRAIESALIARWNLMDMTDVLGPSLMEFDRMTSILGERLGLVSHESSAKFTEQMSEEAARIILIAGEAVRKGDAAGLDEARARLTAFSDIMQTGENDLRAAGVNTRKLFRGVDGPRSRLYQVVMQATASHERAQGAQVRLAQVERKAREDASRLRATANEVVGATIAKAYQTAVMIMSALTAGTFLTLLVGFFTWRWLTAGIVRPFERLGQTMRKLAEGDLTAGVDRSHRLDVIISMASSVEIFRESMIARHALESDRAALEAANTLRREELEKAVSDFERVSREGLEATLKAVGEIEHRADELASAASDVGARSASASSMTSKVNASIGEAASEVGLLFDSAQKIARSGQEAVRVTQQALLESETARKTVADLNTASESIISVVDLIESIARKTNLLALNATIEAARAGVAGKGFAVVADEVKMLAGQTSQATHTISKQIEAVRAMVAESIRVIAGVEATVQIVGNFNTDIASVVAAQSAATARIDERVEQAARQSNDVAEDVSQLYHAVERAAKAATQLSEYARSVAQQSRWLHVVVEKASAIGR